MKQKRNLKRQQEIAAYKKEHGESLRKLGFSEDDLDLFAIGTVEQIVARLREDDSWQEKYSELSKKENPNERENSTDPELP